MNAKKYAEEMIKTLGLTDAIRVLTSLNLNSLKTAQDLTGTNKKKQTLMLTNNKKTAAYFTGVLGYLRNKEKKK